MNIEQAFETMNELKKPNGKYKQDVIDRSVKLYEKGMKAETVEKLTGMKRRSINYHADKKGIKRSCSNTGFTPLQVKDIKHLYVDCKLSSNQVANIINVPARAIRRFLNREGLMRPKVNALRLRFKRRSTMKAYHKRKL